MNSQRLFEVKFATLHTTLFLGGVNFGLKLDTAFRQGALSMIYDRDDQELLVNFGKYQAIVPITNVATMIEAGVPQPTTKHQPQVASVPGAQVETPTGHVHAGPGRGKR